MVHWCLEGTIYSMCHWDVDISCVSGIYRVILSGDIYDYASVENRQSVGENINATSCIVGRQEDYISIHKYNTIYSSRFVWYGLLHALSALNNRNIHYNNTIFVIYVPLIIYTLFKLYKTALKCIKHTLIELWETIHVSMVVGETDTCICM
jgi:hypothetical protein